MKHILLTLVAAATMTVGASAQQPVKNLYTTAQKLNVSDLQDTGRKVQVNRYFFAGYNTLCLPMSMDQSQLQTAAKDLRLERFAGIGQKGSTLYLYFIDCTEDGIQAGVPYLVYSPTEQNMRAANSESRFVTPDLRTVTMTDAAGNSVSFSSSWETLTENGRYGIPAKQDVYPLESVLIRTEGDKSFLPTRCGFSWNTQANGATELKIKHISDLAEMGTTAVKDIVTDNAAAQDVYDLKGIMVGKGSLDNLGKGIYVVNGKKTLKK